MGGVKLFALGLAAAAAAAAGVWPARGQCRLCDTPTTSRAEPAAAGEVRLVVETSLDFDRLILSGAGDGSAFLRPDGSSSVQGSVAEVSPRAMVGSAIVHGEPGRTVRVELPRRVELFSSAGSSIVLDEIVSDLPSLPRLDSAGKLTFRFGGRLRIAGEAEGDYRGDLPITVEYL